VLRKVLIAAVLVALVSTAAAAAARGRQWRTRQVSLTTTQLMPGVTYQREVDFTPAGPVVLDVVTAPRPDGTVYSLAPALSNESLAGTEKLTGIEKRLDANATTVGIDGDYFNASTGAPSSILMRGGVLDNTPNSGRSSLGIAADGALQMARVAYTGTWQGSAGLRPLTLNSRAGKFTLYTPSFGGSTPAESKVTEVVLSSFPPARPGQALAGAVTQVATSGGTPIPRGGAVLVGRGSANAAQLKTEAPVGQSVGVRLTLTPDWSGLAGAIGGGPLLVTNGKAVFPDGESFLPGALNGHEARGAVGLLAGGRILLVSVEAAGPSYSVGLSSYELALELVKLGATQAIGLGSGGPAGMAFNGGLLTRPTTGSESRISDALVLAYTGVYASPVAPVLSPNGDGVADTQTFSYRLVRPSTVTATLVGPGGATVPLASGAVAPGVHTLTWDGTSGGSSAPEGAWTFQVSATDDRSVTTTAQRTFSLDDTLGSLKAVRGSRGYPVASFVLARQADVVVRVERPNGIAVAVFRLPKLSPGAHRVGWKGKIAGRRAPGGRYQMRVQATSSVGTSSLVAPFSLASHRGK
jgi:flagellar hook assembly protein FlgD